jgi:NADH-quinone oxidoreductase subunit J
LTINLLLLIALTIAALWSVLRKDVVKAAIALAVTSIILTIIMFRLGSPLAAVFELSVCAGLITVIFMSTISLTKPLTAQQEEDKLHGRGRHFAVLPVMVIAAAAVLAFIGVPMDLNLPQAGAAENVRNVLWKERQLDLVGQIVVILAGFFGVLVLFRERAQATARVGIPWMRAILPAGTIYGDKLINGGPKSSEEEKVAAEATHLEPLGRKR